MGSAELCVTSGGELVCDIPVHTAGHRQNTRHDTPAASRQGAIIKGITSAGSVFRPSDWAQRMAAAATVNCHYCGGRGEGRYNPHVRVLHVDGVTCLWLAEELLAIDPPMHAFIMRFAHDNHLKVVEA
jgi:hypothetical protein